MIVDNQAIVCKKGIYKNISTVNCFHPGCPFFLDSSVCSGFERSTTIQDYNVYIFAIEVRMLYGATIHPLFACSSSVYFI